MKIKKFIKEHKEKIIIGGIVLTTAGILVIKRKPINIENTIATFMPNVENDTVDLIITMKNGKKYLFSFDYGELPGMAVELEDSIACIRPQG